MSPAAPARSELHEGPHELRVIRDRVPLRAGEIAAIMGFWAFLAALSAAGRLINPRGPELSPEVASGLLTLSFAEYSIWAVLTVPIFMLAHRFTVTAETGRRRIVLFMALGLVIAILVDALLAQVRMHVLPPPPGRFRQPPSLLGNLLRFQFLYDYMVYLAVFAAALARDYFLRYQARLEETTLLQAQAAKLEAQLADARLTALRSQLNPHFLFNTLNAISSLVERDPRGVRKMIARLGELLRHTLEETESQEIVVERELELLRRYLDIMEVRFQGKLEATVTADEDVKRALVPNLILQPLVENALKHGVSASDGRGRVEVSAVRSGDQVVLTVRDHGPGPGNVENDNGVGLSNTIARLDQLYKSRHGFSLKPAPDGGSVAEIRLPYHEEPERA
jgi:two-component system, LytTR family, sensor kinase